MVNLSEISTTHLPSAPESGPELTLILKPFYLFFNLFSPGRETFPPLPASVELPSTRNTFNTTSFYITTSPFIHTLYTLLFAI